MDSNRRCICLFPVPMQFHLLHTITKKREKIIRFVCRMEINLVVSHLQFSSFPGARLRLPKPRAVIISVLRNGALIDRGIFAPRAAITAANERAGPASMHVWQIITATMATNSSTRVLDIFMLKIYNDRVSVNRMGRLLHMCRAKCIVIANWHITLRSIYDISQWNLCHNLAFLCVHNLIAQYVF